jgi:cytochrome P450
MREAGPTDLETAAIRVRERFAAEFHPTYVENVIIPNFLASTYEGERLFVPMIDVKFTKENALSCDLWGLLRENWKPAADHGITVFLQALEKRGPDNRRKRIYMSALTPDLYRPMYRDKVVRFFEKLLHEGNTGKPLMRPYLESYFDFFWDLHLGVKGDSIPRNIRELGQSFNTVLAYRDPTLRIVYDNYMRVRSHFPFLKQWIDGRVGDLLNGKTPNPQQTFVHWWIRNSGDGEYFTRKDVVFEVIHNLIALFQWGSMLYNIVRRLSKETGDPHTRAWFKKTMQGQYDNPSGETFTPLERFVMELFRVISPNSGSMSVLEEVRTSPYPRLGYIVNPHEATSLYAGHWDYPERFDPDRYNKVPTSHQVDETKCKQMGFAKCPFDRTSFEIEDGRKATIHNSGFGTAYAIVDGNPLPVCDYVGFAPFGFGYRRCPAEQLTIKVFEDFLRKVSQSKLDFKKLDFANPESLPIGPTSVISDDFGFVSAG